MIRSDREIFDSMRDKTKGSVQFRSVFDSQGRLSSLFIHCNPLSSIPSEISRFTNLTLLQLRSDTPGTIPPVIGQLTNLTTLDVRSANLKKLPSEIGQLTNLKRLYLDENQLSELPPEIGELKDLIELTLDYNPLETPPPEVIRQGVESIRNYFRQLQLVGSDRLYEAKLLIVGEPGAGKTSLAKKIDDPKYRFAGKTGTAQVKKITKLQRELDLDTAQIPYEERDHAWYVAFGPYKDPRYSLCVLVEHGGVWKCYCSTFSKKTYEKNYRPS